MNNFLKIIKLEFFHILPAYLFFLVSFLVVNYTQAIMYVKKGIPPYPLLSIVIGTMLVAKVLVLIDHLSFINLFPKKPLIYNIIWKTIIYTLGSLIMRVTIRVISFAIAHHDFQIGVRQYLEALDYDAFIAIQCWYTILFFVYVSFKELIMHIGPKKAKKVIFGK